jgi:hypothetical protein
MVGRPLVLLMKKKAGLSTLVFVAGCDTWAERPSQAAEGHATFRGGMPTTSSSSPNVAEMLTRNANKRDSLVLTVSHCHPVA